MSPRGSIFAAGFFFLFRFLIMCMLMRVFLLPVVPLALSPSGVLTRSAINMLKRKGDAAAAAPASKQGKTPVDQALIESTYAA